MIGTVRLIDAQMLHGEPAVGYMETVFRSNAQLAAVLRRNIDVGADEDDLEEIVVLFNPMPFSHLTDHVAGYDRFSKPDLVRQ